MTKRLVVKPGLLEGVQLQHISAAKQRRLDRLMNKNNEGTLTPAERREFKKLVRQTEELSLANARAIAKQLLQHKNH